jgi:hypothetical protein
LKSDRGLVDSKTSISSDPFVGLDLVPDDIFRAVETVQTLAVPIGMGHYICTAAEITEAFVRYVILCEKKAGIIYKAFEVVSNHSISETCSVDTKLKILSTVFDRIRNYSQIKSSEVFLMNIFLRSVYNDDSKNDITRDEVVSRVLDVIQSYPEVSHQVTEGTDISKDLGLEVGDWYILIQALYLEFKLYVPWMMAVGPCKQIIDFIYDNRMKRMDFENFRDESITGHVFWPVESMI